jgi:hypothetical protein
VPRILLDRYVIELSINGEDVDWNEVALEEFSLHESVKQRYPTAELTFTCSLHNVVDNPVVDASPIVITLTDTQIDPPSPPQTYRMRAFNFKFKPITQFFKWYVSLQLDAKDLHTSRIKSYGPVTSSDAIAAAAADAGLSADCDQTADTQVWLRPNERGTEFIYRTARNSWAGPTSCFVTGILATHELRHYNLYERMQRQPTWIFRNVLQEVYAPAANEILFEDAAYTAFCGTTNSYSGYGRTNSSYDIITGFEFPAGDVAAIFTNVANMATGSQGSQRPVTMAYDSDNTHQNYTLAAAQNVKIKALFSTRIDLTTRFGRHVKLLDYVSVLPYAMGLNEFNGGLIEPWAGNYFVSEIHTLVSPAAIGKKYVVVREGMNVTGNRGLLGESG